MVSIVFSFDTCPFYTIVPYIAKNRITTKNFAFGTNGALQLSPHPYHMKNNQNILFLGEAFGLFEYPNSNSKKRK